MRAYVWPNESETPWNVEYGRFSSIKTPKFSKFLVHLVSLSRANRLHAAFTGMFQMLSC